MIGRIAGIILHRARDHVLVDVHGVGYVVHVSEQTAASLPPAGQHVALYTELQVREDLLQLIGFRTLIEKEWHRLLVSVQGVGTKVSLAIIGTLGPESLARSITLEDWSTVRKAPGVGPKLAQRIVLELKNKAPAIMALGGDLTVDAGDFAAPEPVAGAGDAGQGDHPQASSPAARSSNSADAVSALMNLGYGPSEAATAIATVQAQEPSAEVKDLIRMGLKSLMPKG